MIQVLFDFGEMFELMLRIDDMFHLIHADFEGREPFRDPSSKYLES